MYWQHAARWPGISKARSGSEWNHSTAGIAAAMIFSWTMEYLRAQAEQYQADLNTR
jgi:hypothetical protein